MSVQLVTEALLVLNPTGKTSGGTVIGRVDAANSVIVTPEFETTTDPVYGAGITHAALCGANAAFSSKLMDYSPDALNLITNNLGQTWLNGGGTYKLGHFFGAGNLHKLLLRPIDRNGQVVATRPFAFFPRGFNATPLTIMWHRQIEVAAAFDLLVLGLIDPVLGRPVLVGDPDDWPENWHGTE